MKLIYGKVFTVLTMAVGLCTELSASGLFSQEKKHEESNEDGRILTRRRSQKVMTNFTDEGQEPLIMRRLVAPIRNGNDSHRAGPVLLNWEALPLELKDQILDQLPGHDQFLNEMVRMLNLRYPLYEKIIDAFLAYYLDKFQDLPAPDEIPQLMNKHFKTVKFETCTAQFLKAFDVLRKQNSLSSYQPLKEHIFQLRNYCFNQRTPLLHRLIQTDLSKERKKNELRKVISIHRYGIKLIDRSISSSLINRCFYYTSKIEETLWRGFQHNGWRNFLLMKLIEIELITFGLTCLPVLGNYMMLGNFGQLSSWFILSACFSAVYLCYLGASNVMPYIIAFADLPAPERCADLPMALLSLTFIILEKILGIEFEQIMKCRASLDNSLRLHEGMLAQWFRE